MSKSPGNIKKILNVLFGTILVIGVFLPWAEWKVMGTVTANGLFPYGLNDGPLLIKYYGYIFIVTGLISIISGFTEKIRLTSLVLSIISVLLVANLLPIFSFHVSEAGPLYGLYIAFIGAIGILLVGLFYLERTLAKRS